MSYTENVLIYGDGEGEEYTQKVRAVNALEVEGTPSTGDAPIVQGDGSVEWAPGGGGGGLVYKGTWDAATNNPALASGVGTNGDYYEVNVAGSTNLDGITSWDVGDKAIFNGTIWQKVDGGSDTVTHNDTLGLQGGTASEYYHLTNSEHTDIQAQIANPPVVDSYTGTDTPGAGSNALADGQSRIWKNTSDSKVYHVARMGASYYTVELGTWP